MSSIKCVPNEYGTFSMPAQNLEPYEPGECPHEKRFVLRGRLRCENCGATYDETTLDWVSNE